MTRQDALQTLQFYVKTQNLIRHHLAVEAAMRAIAQKLISKGKTGIDIDTWGITGLLHDADYELTRNTPEKHTLYLEEKIGDTLSPEILYAIKAHNYKYTNVPPKTEMDWALYTCDELTGFIVACALILKKDISAVTVDFVLRKMNEKGFAKSVDRAQITACEKALGFTIAEYTGIVLTSMQAIAVELGFEQ